MVSNPATSPATGAPLKLGEQRVDWRRIFFIFLGIGAFYLFYVLPIFSPAVDPAGKAFPLSREGQLALGLFLMAGIWWVFEVVPIGVTSIMIGVVQAMFSIRPAKEAFGDFMDPSVLFILGSLMLGLAFTKTGLTKRMAFKMLGIVGENTRTILLGTYLVIVLLTFVMAHTAVAATVFPLLMLIMSLYAEEDRPTRFGKALFIGMAYAAGAGSICTLLGAARGPAAFGLYEEFTGQTLSFLQLSVALMPFGLITTFIIWFLLAFVFFRPEKSRIPGVKERVAEMAAQLGLITPQEIFVLLCTAAVVVVLAIQNFVPALKELNRSVPMLVVGLLFFLTRIFTVEDLEKRIPWNIVLLFSGAMSIGFCLWKTGAAQWMAVKWLVLFQHAHWIIFVLAIAAFVLILTNFIMNVAAIACSLPVALVIAQYLHVNPELVLWASLAMAGLPFLLLIGAAPNAIAYQSKQFTPGEFLLVGILPTIIVLLMVALFAVTYWPLVGIPPLVK
ncbi:SLC13 family permease [Thermodesulfitimonas autotrophica]|uniref:SLC13 family permease n=1 Tax=Thermodesulfitimonas autotrophica TaxID=1894989 RepID=UPI002FE3ABC3